MDAVVLKEYIISTKNVIAGYQIDNGFDIPRLNTNYLEGK